jgi:hypothetical protein
MSSDRKLLRIKGATFQTRGSSGYLYEVERIDNVLEERDGTRVAYPEDTGIPSRDKPSSAQLGSARRYVQRRWDRREAVALIGSPD